jgi:FAD/FMN-containing dehydrogenase/Fe-S oxidoreductase
MTTKSHREIPYNYTSLGDRPAVSQLLGAGVWEKLETLRARRVTGRSARLLMRFFGEVLIHRRNPYLFQELVDSPRRRQRCFDGAETSLRVIEQNSDNEPLVGEVLSACRELLRQFRAEVEGAPALRARIRKALGEVVGQENVLFDPFSLIAHSTDATDWRLHLPLCVVTPTAEEQVAPLLGAIALLELHAIPRGGGTGLTGGAIPLRPDCVVVNTEKLDRIRGIVEHDFLLPDGRQVRSSVMAVEAGVITEQAMEHAAERGLVFATDPTSAWASTIGGNIAENAGGKDCVLWGTCIDNLVSFRIAMPAGGFHTVRRVNHPLRKIHPEDLVRFEVSDDDGRLVRAIELRGDQIRKKGLWKDITNKVLGGLPGVQKEGTDGIITSAEFILYSAYPHSRTLCLEFFGPSFDEASQVIQQIAQALPDGGEEALMALEHFDEQYVRAIDYQVKAPRAETPKAVLVIDVVGRTTEQVERGLATIRRLLTVHENTCLAVARDRAEAKRFWADRKKLGAIARRTNAFKLNEDVVLPLSALAEFARFVDATNLREERHNQETVVHRMAAYLRSAPSQADGSWSAGKLDAAVGLCDRALASLAAADEQAVRSLSVVGRLRRELGELMRGYPGVSRGLDATCDEVRARLIVLATHMHAGDGNVHVNIPVLSNDRPMLLRAEAVVDRVFLKVNELQGVVSGEHGIGVTKLRYWDPERRAELEQYRREADPGGLMNPGKLSDLEALEHIFTPSYNLLELEAHILRHGSLEALAKRIATCVRCGKCKADCCVFYPPRGVFYHPRNKNLAVGALIEALLYDAQRERSTSFDFLRHLEEVADHCTICHKCLKPCPVEIDTGEVSVMEREILAGRGLKHTAAATRLTLGYLGSRSPAFNRAFRAGVLRLGTALQRAGHGLAAPLQRSRRLSSWYALRMVRSPLPRVDEGTLRDLLPECGPSQALLIEPSGAAARTAFYFPGCGSERLYSRVSMAALHLLLELGARVVMPPPFLCCGFPMQVNARTEEHGRTVLRNTILLSQIREMLAHLAFDAVVVTCGTCREGLEAMEVEKIFQAPLLDAVRWAADLGLRLDGQRQALYHAPCHDSLQGQAGEVLARVGGYSLGSVPHCCSEAGTLALSRPDITDAMLQRKAAALQDAQRAPEAGGALVLTNCPSCLQGLGRHGALGVTPRHVAVELALRLSGERWEEELRGQVANAQAVHF